MCAYSGSSGQSADLADVLGVVEMAHSGFKDVDVMEHVVGVEVVWMSHGGEMTIEEGIESSKEAGSTITSAEFGDRDASIRGEERNVVRGADVQVEE